ncbi:hypothetical protein BJY01DRAFT_255717 [Aspergillus pseudoustus]|uniref:Uncharacterized protein n=1 Tax=Aspergillus pseudoustus TaxID=1810923 RepID=A0ABR4II54_9EURO
MASLPSTGMTVAVTNDDFSDTSHLTASATSSGVAARPYRDVKLPYSASLTPIAFYESTSISVLFEVGDLLAVWMRGGVVDGVVDGDVQFTKCQHCFADHLPHADGVGHVRLIETDRVALTPQIIRDLHSAHRVDFCDDNAGSGLREGNRDRIADAAVAAGHAGDSSVHVSTRHGKMNVEEWW